jgi:hypothetical protein
VPYRFIDALVGGVVGLAVLIAVPRNPLTALRQAVGPPLETLAGILGEIALALEKRDAHAAGEALRHARSASSLADAFYSALGAARETARLAPTHWRNQAEVARYAHAAEHVDYAYRNVRVLARAARTALEEDSEIPAGLIVAIRQLAEGVSGLERELADPSAGVSGIEQTLLAAGSATRVLEPRPSLRVNVMVGQIRSIATDLIGALGVERHEAVQHVRAAGRRQP